MLDKCVAVLGELVTARVYFGLFNNEVKTDSGIHRATILPCRPEVELVAEVAYMQQLERSLYRVQDFTQEYRSVAPFAQ